ncbi:hypothetical protein B0H19DRAFT_1112255 [Mycena capillaripes]|nr:hypothetical protein B0H19DRAFT_1112255 [Mycena capillaripes]
MSILAFSIELLQEIFYRIPSDHKHLRVVCKNFNFAIAPLFFSSVLLDVQQSGLELGLSHLEALATGNTSWSQFARTLKIERLSPSYKFPASKAVQEDKQDTDNELKLADERMKKFLPSALESLKNVRTVIWTSRREDAEWTAEAVADYLNSHPTLEDFRLTADGLKSNCSFNQLNGLRKLSLTSHSSRLLTELTHSLSEAVRNSPDLASLHLQSHDFSCDAALSFTDLFHGDLSCAHPHLTELHLNDYTLPLDGIRPHLRALKSLWWFRGYSWTEEGYPVPVRRGWDVLREERIHLTEIHTDIIDEDLLAYLSSSSGLERLTISSAGGDNEEQSNRRADDFFAHALPRHRSSLVALSCHAEYEGRWSFGAHNAGVILQLHKLRSLRMSVNSVPNGYAPPVGQAGGSGRGSRKLYKIENDEDGHNMVHRFLDLIIQLPIMDAVIFASTADHLRNHSCGNPMVSHHKSVLSLIDAAVRGFEFTAPLGHVHVSSAVVLAGYSYFKMNNGTGRYDVAESANLSWPYSYEHLLRERS